MERKTNESTSTFVADAASVGHESANLAQLNDLPEYLVLIQAQFKISPRRHGGTESSDRPKTLENFPSLPVGGNWSRNGFRVKIDQTVQSVSQRFSPCCRASVVKSIPWRPLFTSLDPRPLTLNP